MRRFNFMLYQDWKTETWKMQRNPDVTVRSRGVMEKCTYCVQRIREAEIKSATRSDISATARFKPRVCRLAPRKRSSSGIKTIRESGRQAESRKTELCHVRGVEHAPADHLSG